MEYRDGIKMKGDKIGMTCTHIEYGNIRESTTQAYFAFYAIPIFHILTCVVTLESCSACIVDNILLYT